MDGNYHPGNSHSGFDESAHSVSLPLHPSLLENERSFDQLLDSWFGRQENLLRIMLEQGRKLEEEFEFTLTRLQSITNDSAQQEAKLERDAIQALKEVCFKIPNTNCVIKLASPIGQVLYKNKPFSLKVTICGIENLNSLNFSLRIKAFTYEVPPKEIIKSSKNEQILRNSRIQDVGTAKKIKFKRVSFTGITSKFPLRKVIFMIYSEERNDLLPLIIPGIQVKARFPSKYLS
ncbi:unnamed protein product [Blepharisma stoltei]|uniref:Uncharacterized protein n=1 Tax=Blepharisma stoltei TaxID=1481888 RepID=A0AAU9J8A8_9CILI|nr:unnamed protein product [Blepharisma stoltei]